MPKGVTVVVSLRDGTVQRHPNSSVNVCHTQAGLVAEYVVSDAKQQWFYPAGSVMFVGSEIGPQAEAQSA
jgi:hypothetical protein